jgi:hypothetical protein
LPRKFFGFVNKLFNAEAALAIARDLKPDFRRISAQQPSHGPPKMGDADRTDRGRLDL